MSVQPPYLYTPSTRQSVADPYYNFDPKAVSRASYAASFASTPSQRPKQEGPLINFNKHPDSYVIVPYGSCDLEPMPANTRKKVVVTRRIQLVLRVLQLVGVLGLLVCVICLKGVDETQSWILRIPVSGVRSDTNIFPDRIITASLGCVDFMLRYIPPDAFSARSYTCFFCKLPPIFSFHGHWPHSIHGLYRLLCRRKLG